MAPEVLERQLKRNPDDFKDDQSSAYSWPVDIWSVGIVTYELLCCKPAYTGKTVSELKESIYIRGLEFPQFLSRNAISFITACLQTDPAARPSATDLLSHALIQTYYAPLSTRHNPGAMGPAARNHAVRASMSNAPGLPMVSSNGLLKPALSRAGDSRTSIDMHAYKSFDASKLVYGHQSSPRTNLESLGQDKLTGNGNSLMGAHYSKMYFATATPATPPILSSSGDSPPGSRGAPTKGELLQPAPIAVQPQPTKGTGFMGVLKKLRLFSGRKKKHEDPPPQSPQEDQAMHLPVMASMSSSQRVGRNSAGFNGPNTRKGSTSRPGTGRIVDESDGSANSLRTASKVLRDTALTSSIDASTHGSSRFSAVRFAPGTNNGTPEASEIYAKRTGSSFKSNGSNSNGSQLQNSGGSYARLRVSVEVSNINSSSSRRGSVERPSRMSVERPSRMSMEASKYHRTHNMGAGENTSRVSIDAARARASIEASRSGMMRPSVDVQRRDMNGGDALYSNTRAGPYRVRTRDRGREEMACYRLLIFNAPFYITHTYI